MIGVALVIDALVLGMRLVSMVGLGAMEESIGVGDKLVPVVL